ncbi:MAG TPA: hypothetical protein PKA06_16640, partial [Gemmatales bacterium]|nr:hypothetical protein [Gemmatales bacterium]
MPRMKTKPSFTQTVAPAAPGPASSGVGKATLPVSPPGTHFYFVNAPVDFLIVGLGSILTFFGLYFVYGTDSNRWAAELALVLTFIINNPHFAATNYRLYHTRDNILQYPITALVIPWVILALVIASFYSPKFVAPIFYKVFLYWSPYHFSGQTLGVTLIYARRAGFFVGKWERFTLSNVIYGSFLYMTARGDMITAATDIVMPQVSDVDQYRLGLPMWVSEVILVWMVLNALAFTSLVVKWCYTQHRLLPPIVLLPVVTQIIWFIPGAYVKSFYLFVPMFHSLQYLLIAWSLHLKEKMDLQKITPSARYVISESLRWGFINIVVGLLLFWG